MKLDACLASLHKAIGFRTDVEVWIIHDGPTDYVYKGSFRFVCTPTRVNKSGHNSRNYGIYLSHGKFILHTNYDNIYYSDVFDILDSNLEDNTEIYSMQIKMMGMFKQGNAIAYDTPRDYNKYVILNGKHLNKGMVDCMQVIVSRRIWLEFGGWTDWSVDSDGKYYEAMGRKYPHKNISKLIGEHY
jgi:hypothetical protein